MRNLNTIIIVFSLVLTTAAEARWYPGKFLGRRNNFSSPKQSKPAQNQHAEQAQVEQQVRPEVATPPPESRLEAQGTETQQAQIEQKEEGKTGYIPGRWFGNTFQYKDRLGNFRIPTEKIIADKDSSFKNAQGQEVEYQKGDILFKVGNFGWFKASKDSEKIDDGSITKAQTERAQKILEFSQQNIGKQVGGGYCNGLPEKAAGPRISDWGQNLGTVSAGHKVTVALSPGQILDWNRANFGNVFTSDKHYAIVEKVYADGSIDILHQNMGGKHYVVRNHINPTTMLGGSMVVYQP